MANAVPDKALGKPSDSSNVEWMMPDPNDDFKSLIEQAVTNQDVSCYNELNPAMRRALVVAALREHKIDACEADMSSGLNEILDEVFDCDGNAASLQKLYAYLVAIFINGNSTQAAHAAYYIDQAIDKEADQNPYSWKYRPENIIDYLGLWGEL